MSKKYVTLKIYELNEEMNSLVVAFNSEKATKNIDEQNRYNYELSMFDTTDPDLIIKHIARSGMSIVEMQDKREAVSKNTTLKDAFHARIGQTLTFEEKALYNQLDEVAIKQNDEDITI